MPLARIGIPDTVNGFDTENNRLKFMAAREVIGSGAFDAVVMTEMVELE
jgi:hypothetical protein